MSPTEKVTDYRTHVSGVRPTDLLSAPAFEKVQKKVKSIVKDRIIVGHGLENDFAVLHYVHPEKVGCHLIKKGSVCVYEC